MRDASSNEHHFHFLFVRSSCRHYVLSFIEQEAEEEEEEKEKETRSVTHLLIHCFSH